MDQEQAIKTLLYERQKYSKLIAYLLWGFLGWLGTGAHRFYVGSFPTALIQIALNVAGWMALLYSIGLSAFNLASVTGGDPNSPYGASYVVWAVAWVCLAVWLLIDAYWLHNRIEELNVGVHKNIFEQKPELDIEEISLEEPGKKKNAVSRVRGDWWLVSIILVVAVALAVGMLYR